MRLKLIIKITSIIYSSLLFSQKKDSVFFNINVEKFKNEASKSFDIYFKNTLEFDSIVGRDLKLLTKYEPIKDSLHLINIPQFEIKLTLSVLNKGNYLNIFNFNHSEYQKVYVKNRKNFIISTYQSYFDFLSIPSFIPLIFSENYTDHIGSGGTEYSIYDFKDNFYFFAKKFNCLFEIDNGKLYAIFVFADCKTIKEGVSIYDTLKLNGQKNPKCIEIIKIEFNTYMNKMFSKKELKEFCITGKLNKKFFKKDVKKLKRLSKRNDDTYEIKIIE